MDGEGTPIPKITEAAIPIPERKSIEIRPMMGTAIPEKSGTRIPPFVETPLPAKPESADPKVFIPAGQKIRAFSPRENVEVKMHPAALPPSDLKSEVKMQPLHPTLGKHTPAKVVVGFAPVPPGQPMNRPVKVAFWPGDLLGADSTKVKLRAIQPVATESQPAPAPAPAPRAEKAPVMDDPMITVSVERMVFLQRVERLMASEARIHELETENKLFLVQIASLGGDLAKAQAEIQILKAKKG